MPAPITIQTTISASAERVWDCYTQPEHITQWNFASPEWCCPSATNDLRPGGKFSWRMEARDGSMGFDYEGEYDAIEPGQRIASHLGDGRKVETTFRPSGDQIKVTTTFEIEDENTADMQRQGWQSILDNFKRHAESP